MHAPTPQEQEAVETLLAMMGEDGISADDALRVLRKYNGDMDRTATALLEGETGGVVVEAMDTSWSGGPAVGPRTPPRKCATMSIYPREAEECVSIEARTGQLCNRPHCR